MFNKVMLDPDLNELLKKNLEVSQRTLYLVEKMHRGILWGRFFSFLKWAIIIGVSVWSYIALQPYLQKALGIGQQLGNLQKSLPAGGNLDSLKNLLK